MESKHTLQELQQWQSLPLNIKVLMTKDRIRQWVNEYGEDGVYVSFSGGKDSTVLLSIVREMYPDIPAVFCDTGLEYPEIREFVKTWDGVTWIKPKLTFRQVIEKCGYPFISKEVAECVFGARKYLTRVLQETESLDRQTDRQTDRPQVGTAMCTETLRTRRVCKTRSYAYQWEKLTATGRYGKPSNKPKYHKLGGGVDQLKASPTLLESERLTTALMRDSGKAIDNIRIQRLMGILPKEGKATQETIPSKGSRSMFSCERYQFFLDAPFEIGQQCCGVMKKSPFNRYHKDTKRHPITAMMASESRLRTQKWLAQGCNAFDAKKPMSMPMAFWTEQDVLLYIYQNKLPIASVYGEVVKDQGEIDGQMDLEDCFGKELFELDRPTLKTTGCSRTGCMFCGFGCHLEKPGEGRFERMKVTHPKQYKYLMSPWEYEEELTDPETGEVEIVKRHGLGYKEVIDWINENGHFDIRY